LTGKIEKLNHDIDVLEKRLSKPSFVEKAPEKIVTETHEKLKKANDEGKKLQKSLKLLESLS
jgi:valyl-tRNA synthetase